MTDIQNGPAPMLTPHELVRTAQSASISWHTNAPRGPVSLIEHDSVLVALIGMCDLLANPRAAEWATRNRSQFIPYATIPYYDTSAAPGTSTPRGWRNIPAFGVYPRPSNADAAKLWDAMTALIWRLADLSKESAAPGAQALPADVELSAVFGEAAEATVTTPGRQFTEDRETVALVPLMVASTMAYVDRRAGLPVLSAFAEAEARAVPIRDALAAERGIVSKRGQTRALVTGAVAIGAAYAYSRM